jgi:cytochrome c oxidase subunit 2
VRRNPARTAFLLAGLLAGCQAEQSALEPHGDQAAAIADVAWLLFAMAGAVMTIVLLAVALAISAPEGVRRMLAGSPAVIVGGIAFPVVVLSFLLFHGLSLTESESRSGNPDLRIDVTGEQWWWRVTYFGEDGKPIRSANEIRMPVGANVEFTLTTADVIHAFWVPSLGGKVDMVPGRTNRLTLRAEREGIYRGQCAEYCGGPHAWMGLSVIAMPPAAYVSWLEAEAATGVTAADDTAWAGRELFLASGCGGCHTIRGINATGTIGPDLTHLGSRRSVGIDTLPLSPDNIARFIADGQHIKPGNRMPPFRIFTETELAQLSGYLAGLK